MGFSGCSTRLSSWGSRALEHRLTSCGASCSMARGLFPDQGSNPCLPDWQGILYHWATSEAQVFFFSFPSYVCEFVSVLWISSFVLFFLDSIYKLCHTILTWLTSLDMFFFRYIHVSANGKISFCLMVEYIWRLIRKETLCIYPWSYHFWYSSFFIFFVD